ncbi:MAG: hypothetical protein M3397_11520 [Actinomycetota bacterium]|nr:hypothetical protein [Rubrobacter sp.]MDQ3568692.1 hypothetical protein [Actinomycetota bacterium]
MFVGVWFIAIFFPGQVYSYLLLLVQPERFSQQIRKRPDQERPEPATHGKNPDVVEPSAARRHSPPWRTATSIRIESRPGEGSVLSRIAALATACATATSGARNLTS